MNKKSFAIMGLVFMIGGVVSSKGGQTDSSSSSTNKPTPTSSSPIDTSKSTSSAIPEPTYATLTYGTYPQSKVTDSSLITTLTSQVGTLPSAADSQDWTSYKFYQGIKQADKTYLPSNETDYFWYKDVTVSDVKYRGVYFTNQRPTQCYFGFDSDSGNQIGHGYAVETVHWFKFEDITWRILDNGDDQKFVMADKILDSEHFYHQTKSNELRNRSPYDSMTKADVYDNNYQYSDIRGWLNTDFYSLAFTSTEQADIKITSVDNSQASGYGASTYYCDNTQDKVFLPSFSKLTNTSYQFHSASTEDHARKAYATDYAKCLGVATSSSNGTCYWYTRTPQAAYSNNVRVIQRDGKLLNEDGSDIRRNTNTTSMGIRPAMNIDSKVLA